MTAAPRPDPKRGVFETILIRDGHPVELEAHLNRLGESLEVLFGELTPSAAAQMALSRAHGIALGRLRLTVSPAPDGTLRAEVKVAEIAPAAIFPSPQAAIALGSRVIEGGLGEHKWIDRRLLGAPVRSQPAEPLALILDTDGSVLEASRANVFALRAGVLLTPKADGRLLPGIGRRRVIEIATEQGIEVREESIGIAELVGAEEVFLSGSLRGVEQVAAIDQAALARGEVISAQIAACLRRRWLAPGEAGGAPGPAAGPPHDRPVR
ncbi:MAG: aminotransferase class IV [Solirubrobacterales bacterium]